MTSLVLSQSQNIESVLPHARAGSSMAQIHSMGVQHGTEVEADRDRMRGASEDRHSEDNDSDQGGDAHGKNDGDSNSDGPSRKRRRSRKGLEKKFECPTEGCGKSYSRAEHL